jgi:hypothetical protein
MIAYEDTTSKDLADIARGAESVTREEGRRLRRKRRKTPF